jgi:ABC-2 type transport system ATP-binding protein
MIEVEGLTKYYGAVRGIEDVSFTVAKGEIVGFLGPNGSGKSTTMRILTCVFPPTTGKAVVAGLDVFKKPLEVKRKIGYLPESVPLYPDMRVDAYLSFVAEAKGIKKGARKRHIANVMEECGIKGVAHRLVGNLSKGFRQRVGIAQALIHDPEVLILDEPTIGLDPKQTIEMRELIKRLKGERTIILSSHILPEVSITCERVIIIHEGRIIAVDKPENLVNRLQKATRTYLKIQGPSPLVMEKLKTIPGILEVERQEAFPENTYGYMVDSQKDAYIGSHLSRFVLENNWNLWEMKTVGMSLEDIFIRLVSEEDRGAR